MVGVPIGIDQFGDLRENGYDYVDKSGLIASLKDSRYSVYLFTRPRRFGKSLNLSMLDCYFNMDYVGNTWFDGLKVSELCPDDPDKNAYPVIRMDLKGLMTDTEEHFRSSMRLIVSLMYDRMGFLADSDRLSPRMRSVYDDIVWDRADDSTFEMSIGLLSRMLEAHTGRKAVVLIDEYDNPVNGCEDGNLRKKILGAVKNLLSNGVKGNPSLKLAVITGIMQIAKEGMFSGMNNAKVENVLSTDFDEYYGFTEEEVAGLLERHGLSDRAAEVREWYDGYRFGNRDVYNPWSILNYIGSGGDRAFGYWASTSTNEIAFQLLDSFSHPDWTDTLFKGGSVPMEIRPTITYAELHDDPEAMFQIMVMSGYLSARHLSGETYEVRFPNREVRDIFRDALNRTAKVSSTYILLFERALEAGDADAAGDSLSKIFAGFESFRALNRESDYQNFIFGLLLGTIRGYRPSLEGEAGHGYYDILLESTDASRPNIVIELKRLDPDASADAAEEAAGRALEQIRAKGYHTGQRGGTIAYGMAFRSKKPTVRVGRISAD